MVLHMGYKKTRIKNASAGSKKHTIIVLFFFKTDYLLKNLYKNMATGKKSPYSHSLSYLLAASILSTNCCAVIDPPANFKKFSLMTGVISGFCSAPAAQV